MKSKQLWISVLCLLCCFVMACNKAESESKIVQSLRLDGMTLDEAPPTPMLERGVGKEAPRQLSTHSILELGSTKAYLNPRGECCRVSGSQLELVMDDGTVRAVKRGEKVHRLETFLNGTNLEIEMIKSDTYVLRMPDQILLVTTTRVTKRLFFDRYLKVNRYLISDFILMTETHQLSRCRYSVP